MTPSMLLADISVHLYVLRAFPFLQLIQIMPLHHPNAYGVHIEKML